MIKSESPTFWELKTHIGTVKTHAIIVNALLWLAKLINIDDDRNLNEVQIAEIVNDISTQYGYLKVEELKYIFKQSVQKKQIYGRLDYNIIMNWIKEYDDNRTDLCIDISNQQDSQAENKTADPERPGAISFSEYRQQLQQRADNGDADAADTLARLEVSPPKASLSQREDKENFRQFRINHILSRYRNK